MRLSRRSFLKGMAAIAGATAVGIYLPSDKAIAALIEPEPERKFYQAAVAPEPVIAPAYNYPQTFIYQLKLDKVHWEPHVDQTHPFREGGAQYDDLWVDAFDDGTALARMKWTTR